MAVVTVATFDAENGTVGQKPPSPLTAVTAPNIPLITASPVYAGSKAYDVLLDKNKPTILGQVWNPYRTEMRGAVGFEFERVYGVGFAFRRTEWDYDTDAESWPMQVHEAPSNWANWGTGNCRQSAFSTAPLAFHNQAGQLRFIRYGGVTLWSKPIDLNVWHTVVIVFKISKGSTGFIRSWYDGVEQARYPTSGFATTHRPDSAMHEECGPDQSVKGDVVFVAPILSMGIYKWNWKDGSGQTSLTTRRRGTMDSFKVVYDLAGDETAVYNAVNPGSTPDTTAPTISAMAHTTTASTATVTFTTNESSTTRINYGLTTAYGTVYNNTSLVTNHSAQLTGLTPNTTYNYQIQTTDSSGNTATSANRSFVTAVAAEGVTNVVVTNNSSSSVTITWTTASLTSSRIDYGTTTSYGSILTDAALVNNHSLTLTGLSPFQTYNYKLSGTGTTVSAESGNLTFTTLSAITNVVATVLGTTSVRITWTSTASNIGSVAYGLTTAYGLAEAETAARTSHSVTLTGLTAGTLYHYKVVGDDGIQGTDLTFTTQNAVSGISGIGLNRTSTSVTVTWTTDTASTSVVDYGQTSSYELGAITDSTLVTSHSVTVSGLNSSSWYNFRITSVDATAASVQSDNLRQFTRALSGMANDVFKVTGALNSRWVLVDPLGNCSVAGNGSKAVLSIPSGTTHDAFTAGAYNAPRVRQACNNTDFDIQVKIIDTPPATGNNGAGIWIEQDATNFIRFDLDYISGSVQRLFYCATITNSTLTQRFNSNVSTVVQTYPAHLRMKRTGNTFEIFRSNDGITWVSLVTPFTHTMTVNFAGFHGVNAGSNPARNIEFDYFLVDPPASGTTSGVSYTEDSESYSIPVNMLVTAGVSYTDVVGDGEDTHDINVNFNSYRETRFHNRVKELSTSAGPYSFTVTGAAPYSKTLASRYALNESFSVCIRHLSIEEWIVGQGHLKDSTTVIIDTVESSSNSDDFVTFSAGTKEIYVCVSEEYYQLTNSVVF